MEATTNMQLVLNAQTYGQCIDQARELVSEYDAAPGRKAALAKVASGKTGKGKQAAAVVDDEELSLDTEETEEAEELGNFDDLGGETEEAEELEAKPAKTGKGKKLTEKDVNVAAMAYAKVHGRQKTLALLTKKFKKPIKSILELKPEQYSLAIQTLGV